MAIGINITDNVKIELGEIKEQLLSELSSNNIEYHILFDKVVDNNVKETIIHIPSYKTEISIENDIITYIKSGNTDYTCLDTMSKNNDDTFKHIQNIKNKINELFNSDLYTIKIEKLNTDTLNITLILSSTFEKVRVHILRDTDGAIFINTIRSI